ncbi:MAG: hypothetical protein M3406_10745 [Chloroflexota bacterium]|nr:hypothetical protein [Chloroflexota bacterium]
MRLALLILDNAAELQLDRRVRSERQSEDLRERLQEMVSRIPSSERSESLEDLADWQPLSKAQKRALDRYFDPKLDYLCERRGILDSRLKTVLSYLHRYRNEAYHEGRVRRETLLTASLLLFEANCQLLLEVYRVAMYSSSEDYSWVWERFGLSGLWNLNDESVKGIVESLRASIVPTVEAVVESLVGHLRSRLAELWDGMDFVVENTALADREEVFKVAQLLHAVERGDAAPETETVDYRAPLALVDVEGLSGAIDNLESVTERLEAFARFSEVEERLEAFERMVYAVVSWVDGQIQHLTDLARGK